MKDPVLELAFAGGIDQSQRAEILDPRASFVMLENLRSPKRGAVTKRYGFGTHANATRVDATTRTAGYRMFAYGKQTCTIDRDVIDTNSPDTDETISRGRVPECGLALMKVPPPPGQSSIAVTDSIRVGDYYVITGASASAATVYACVLAAETGQVVMPYTAVVVGTAGEILGLLGARGTTVMLFAAEGGNADIMMSELDCSSATGIAAGWSAAANSIADADGFLRMGVCSAGTRCYVAYVNSSGGASQVSVKMYDGGAGGTTTINTSSVTPGAVAAGVTAGDTLWVAWNETTAVKVRGFSTTNLATVTATTATVIITAAAVTDQLGGLAVLPASTTASGRLFANDGGGGRIFTRNFTTATGAASASGSTATHFGALLAGAPFRVGSRFYAVCRAPGQDFGNRTLCDVTETNAWLRPVANLPTSLSYTIACARAAAHTTREFWFPFAIQSTGRAYSGMVARFDFDAAARWRPVAHNGVTFLSGGLVSFFDGLRVAESGFVVRPPAVSLSTNGAGTFTATGGGINVVVTYEHADASGNVHMSSVSSPTNIAAFANKTNLAIVVRNLGVSARIAAATDPNTRICIWATANGGEPPYYLVTTLTNTLTSETQTYNMTDHVSRSAAMLMGTGALPGTGAQQDRRAPSGMDHLVSYNGFLVGALGETVFWSGQDVSGEGAWWNPVFQQPLSGGGDVTALECHDGTVYAFKRDRIFAMAGQPPADNGGDGGLGAPVRLAADIGASQPFTCVTSLGIFFVSDRGIELLDRNRGVVFIGEGIQDTFASFPHVTSMAYDADSSCVLIECASGFSAGLGTGTGRTLVFDTRSKVWRSVDRRAVSAAADVPAQDGCMVWDGSAYRYAWLRNNGASYVEDQETKLDAGDVWVRQYAKTGHIHLSGMQGEQHIDRVLLLGDWIADHDLELGIANDYSDTFVPETYDSDALEALALYVIDKDIDQKTGQAIQVEIEDATPTGSGDTTTTGKSADWVALTFAGMGKGGVRRASGAERGGT